MAAITLGSGATLKSRVLEAAILELAVWITQQERVPIQNPADYKSFRINWSSLLAQYNAVFSIPATYNLVGGVNTPQAVNHFQGTPYSSGVIANSTLTSNNPIQDFIQLISLAQNLELDISKNSQNLNLINFAFLTDPFRFEGSFTLNTTETINSSGHASFIVTPYLT